MRQPSVTPSTFTASRPGEPRFGALPSPLALLPMTGLSVGPIEALEAALRSLSRLGDLRGARPVAAVRRISGPALVVGPGGNRLIRRTMRRRHHRRFVRCTCPRPAHRKTDQRPRRDH